MNHKIRIVTVDHYMAIPIPGLDELISGFRGDNIYRVPVIRIFGVTEEGEFVSPRLGHDF